MKPFTKCPRCGSQSNEIRTRCKCGYKLRRKGAPTENQKLFGITRIKLSDFTPVGWLLLFFSLAVTTGVAILIGILAYKESPFLHYVQSYESKLHQNFALVLAIPIAMIGAAVFQAGKWILQDKLGVTVIERNPLSDPEE